MKALLFFLIIISSIKTTAQIKFRHYLSQAILKDAGFEIKYPNVNDTNVRLTLRGVKQGVITVSGNKIIFDIWQDRSRTNIINEIDSNTLLDRSTTGFQILDGRQRVGLPTRVLSVPFKCFTIGLNTFPFRYRPRIVLADTIKAIGSVGSNFNLAFSIGITKGISKITTRGITNYSFTSGIFIGPSSAEIKKENSKTPSRILLNQTNATIAYGLNFVFARNNLGLVVAIGADKALGRNASEWIYDNKLWFGFGINANFLK
jgi:hypothetical protein